MEATAMYDYLVVGAGLTGATFARLAADSGAKVMVIEKNKVAGGLCATEIVFDKLPMCLYGGHIFHTSNEAVWNFVNYYAKWIPYEHRVKACYKNKVYSFPVNKLTMQQIGKGNPIEMFYIGYSEKQWGIPWEEIPEETKTRVTIRDTYDDRYFTDTYQAMPERGYTPFVERMLDGITVVYGVNFLENVSEWEKKASKIIFTGSLDHLTGVHLPYRSLSFDTKVLRGDYQGCATINYTGKEVPYTRIIEHKHFYRLDIPETVVTWEYPKDCGLCDEPYYPIRTYENIERHQKAVEVLREKHPKIIPAGRLGAYRYLNMDEAIFRAMELWRQHD